jgi:hypothetical protein
MSHILGIFLGSPQSPQPVSKSVLEALQRVQVTQGDGGRQGDYQQGFELSLRAERGPGASSDYALLSDPLLHPGQRIVITVTLNATLSVLFDGIIAHRQLSTDSATGQPALKLMGKDLSVLMDLEEKDQKYPGQSDDAIANAILEPYTRYGIHAQVTSPDKSWTPAEEERFFSQHGTDRRYLQRLARRNGFIFQLKPGPRATKSIAYWGPLDYSDTPQKALTTNMGAATNIESLSVVEDALAPTRVVGSLYSEQDEETTPIQIEKSSQSTALAQKNWLTQDPSFVRTLRLVYSGKSAVEAQAMAQGITDRSTESGVRVTGSLDALRYGEVLVAPGVVGLGGAGSLHDGNYYVRKVTHDITPGRYRQHFELTREGLGSLVQKVNP